MKTILGVTLSMGMMMMNGGIASAQNEKMAAPAKSDASAKPPLAVDMKTLDGKDVNLAKKYDGKVVLLVNVASYCGNTKQYTQLEALNKKYAEQGLAVVGVPCNQFGNQEPGTAEDIMAFCKDKYDVKFDLLAKVDVNGDNACELYKRITSNPDPKIGGKIPWNFEKFIIGRDGKVVARVNNRVMPDAANVVKMIVEELAKKAPATKAATTGAAPSN
ncbi:MAG: glutathione peroxidase [Pirellulales bacterium]